MDYPSRYARLLGSGLGIVRLIVMGKPISTIEARNKLDKQDVE